MTGLEFYLRKNLELQPGSAELEEIINYLVSEEYDVDYLKTFNISGKVFITSTSKEGIVFKTKEEIIIMEKGLCYDKTSPIYGAEVHTYSWFNASETRIIEIVPNKYEYMIKNSKGYIKENKNINIIKFPELEALNDELRNEHILLKISNNQLRKKFNQSLISSKNNKKNELTNHHN